MGYSFEDNYSHCNNVHSECDHPHGKSVHFLEQQVSPSCSSGSSSSSSPQPSEYGATDYRLTLASDMDNDDSDADHIRRFSVPAIKSTKQLSDKEINEVINDINSKHSLYKTGGLQLGSDFKFLNWNTAGRGRGKNCRKGVVAVGKKNNANNNFMIINIEERTKIPKWEDENVYNRTEVLAQPKLRPKGFREEKECTYWISKRPPHVPKDGKTKSVATPRVEELAKPQYWKGEWKGVRHCKWEEEYDHPKSAGQNPDKVDWDRLATPKARMDLSFNNPYRPVSEAALKFEATKRLHQLSVPKKKIDCDSYYLWLWNRQPDNKERLHEVKWLSVDKTDMEDARILLRCDLDFTEGKIIERKIKNILPTIEWAFMKKARSVIIISHCGFPNGARDPKLSLEHLMPFLEEALPNNHIVFLDNCIGAEAIALCDDPEAGHVFLLENLRFHPEELGYKMNDDGVKVKCTKAQVEKFRSILLSFGDVYVNDAFTLLDSEYTTNFGDMKKERCYGLHIKHELMVYNYFVVKHKRKRLVAVIGGEYDDIHDIISSLMGKAQEIILGGEIGMMFLHTVKGVDVGEHQCSPYHQKKIRDMMTRARDTGTIINMPSDLVLEHVDKPNTYFTGHAKDGIDDYYRAVDIGPLTRQCYTNIMQTADMLIWYGRMGTIPDGTSVIANMFGEAEDYGIETYLLDKDTLAVFRSLCPGGRVTHITEKSEVTMMLLHRKMPKGLSSLNPYRRKTKKRPPKEAWVSTKPTVYDRPCMKMCNAMDRLSIDDLDLKDKRVVIRCNLDVPMVGGEIEDNFLLRMAVPSIRYTLQCGARAVIIVASLGKPMHARKTEQPSLKPVAAQLAGFLHITAKAVVFAPDPSLTKIRAILKDSYPGTVIVLENINYVREELQYVNDINDMGQKEVEKVNTFCEELSLMGDVYINDTYNNLHIQTASLSGYMGRTRACGFLLKNELRYMASAFNTPRRPILLIMGGMYSKEKMSALKSLLREIDEVIITGRMALAFLKVANNMPTGDSIIDTDLQEQVPEILECAAANSVRLIYPVDFVVCTNLKQSDGIKQQSASVGVPDRWYAADIGYNTSSLFKQAVKRSKMLIWHGVAGYVESPIFSQGTKKLLDVVAAVTQDPDFKVVSVLGGHSILSFIHNSHPDFQGVSHISTGGITCAALIKDRCLPIVYTLTAGKKAQGITRLTVDQSDITGMSVILRANLDMALVPEGEGYTVSDSTAIKLLIPSIKILQKKGAKTITIISTLGNPDGKKDDSLSLRPVKVDLEKKLRQDIRFFENGMSEFSFGAISGGSEGQLYMLENLGFHPEESGWQVDKSGERNKMSYLEIEAYRKKFSELGNVFVNEAMSSLYLCDSSVVGVPAKMRFAGPLLKTELTKFRTFINKKKDPLMLIVGARTNSDLLKSKLSLLYGLLDQVTNVMLVGSVACSYLKFTQPNAKLGATPIDPDVFKLWPRVLSKAKLNGVQFHVPVDFLIDDKVEVTIEDPDQPTPPPPSMPSADDEQAPPDNVKLEPVVKTLKEGLPASNRVLDIGPATLESFQERISESGSIILMGPAGEYDQEDYDRGSSGLATSIKEACTEGTVISIGFGLDTYNMLEHLDMLDAVSHVSLATTTCVNLLCNIHLPGLEALDNAPLKPLKKLSLESFNLKDKRIMIRLDLDIPIVDGVILDTSRIDAAVVTVRYLLDKNAACVVMCGHRGQPNGFRNAYLSLEPLAAEFAKALDTVVNFLPYPCSAKTREILAESKPKSVYLMENLKFYPAEESSPENTDPLDADAFQMEDDGENEGEEEAAPSAEPVLEESGSAGERGEEIKASESKVVPEGGENEEEKEMLPENEVESEESNDEFISFDDPENLDRVMFEQMAPKSRERYIEELSQCGDVFVNDNVRELQSSLTSMTALTHPKKMCGLAVKEFLATSDVNDAYSYKSIACLSPAPPEGIIDDYREIVLNS